MDIKPLTQQAGKIFSRPALLSPGWFEFGEPFTTHKKI